MTDTLASALAQLQSDLPRITKGETARVTGKSKDGTPISYTYAYAGLAHVSDTVLKALGSLGMSWVTRPTLNEQRDFVLAYKLQHTCGDKEEGEYPLQKGTPQEMGSAITYARRYALCAVTGVAPDDDDDDGAAATKAATTRRQQKTAPPAAPAEPPTESPFNKPDTEEQRKQRKMHALFNTVGMRLREERLQYTSEVIGRPVETSKDLTERELAQLLEALGRWAAQLEPPKDAEETT